MNTISKKAIKSISSLYNFKHMNIRNAIYCQISKDFSRIFPVKLGDLGEGTKEGEIKKWYLKEGDDVDEEDQLVEIGTDKLVADIPSPVKGVIHKINYEVGQVCLVGDVLCEVKADEDPNEITAKDEEEKGILPLDKSKFYQVLYNKY